MSWGLVTGAGVALIGGMMASNSAQSAADTEAGAANNATNALQNQYNLSRQDEAPWLQSGQQALGQLNQQMPSLTKPFSMADFQQSPAYQFNLAQGQQAIERSAAARGGMDSGDTMKALDSYTQGLASNQYQNAFSNYNTSQSNTFNRLSSMAGLGQTAASTNASTGNATAQGIAGNITSAGNAQAAAQVAQGNNITSALNTGANTWLGSQYLNRNAGNPSTPSSMSPTDTWQPTQLQMPVLGSSSGY